MALVASPVVVLENNQPFAIRMPVSIDGLSLDQGKWTGSGSAVQVDGDRAIFVGDLRPGERKRITLKHGEAKVRRVVNLKGDRNGVAVDFAGEQLGELTWGMVVKPVKGGTVDDAQASAHEDFHALFKPLALEFRKVSSGAVFDTWTAETVNAGLKLKVDLLAYAEGFLDIQARFTNETADEKKKIYAAVVCRWEQSKVKARTLCYDNRISALADTATSPFRAGEGRHQFTQRGVDWVRTDFAKGASVGWLNDFAPSFTVLDDSKKNSFKQPRYEGASVPQLGQEVQTEGATLYSITEIARSNIKSYRDRLAENTLPARGDGVTFTSRLVFSKKPLRDSDVDQMFVGYTSFNAQSKSGEDVVLSFGTKSVKFGTSYFPYSTLGENFDALKLPGMDREAFWPLAADTVLHWKEFSDDIRRDLRLAKFMGFQYIRLHHLELLAPIPKDVRREYLDFLFGELRHLKLQALVDIYASDEAIVDLLKRYGDVIDTVEIENEILIWGIPVDRPEQWKRTYDAVKAAAPHVRVHLTGYNNTGMFNRLEKLGVPFDRVGLHTYMDSLDAIPSARGYALALGSFCSKNGKAPVITEWNWRQLTRMTSEARAKIYPPIFDNALSTRAIPEMYQFQFNETMAPNLRAGRGNILRHYELINLSRRPKPEAFELMKLIRKYSAQEDAIHLVDTPLTILNLNAKGEGIAVVPITNEGKRTLKLSVRVEAPTNLKVIWPAIATQGGGYEYTIKPGRTENIRVHLQTVGTTPGFYQCFLRFEGPDGFLRYAAIEARLAGAPKLDTETKSAVVYPRGVGQELNLDFTTPCVVVYGTDAPVLEVETAFAIASTLESATGQPIEMVQLNDFPKTSLERRNLILVGTAKSNELVASAARQLGSQSASCVAQVSAPDQDKWLVVTGEDSMGVERAGMDLLLRWWRTAKDSAVRRVGLVEKELPRGGDATKLP